MLPAVLLTRWRALGGALLYTLALAPAPSAAQGTWVLQGPPSYTSSSVLDLTIDHQSVPYSGAFYDSAHNGQGPGGARATPIVGSLVPLPRGLPSEASSVADDQNLKARARITGDGRGGPFNAEGYALGQATATRFWSFQTSAPITSVSADLTVLFDGFMAAVPAAFGVQTASVSVDLWHHIDDFATGAQLVNAYQLHADLSPLRPFANDNLVLRESGVFSTPSPGQTRTPWQQAFTDQADDPFRDIGRDVAYDVAFLATRRVSLPTNTVLAFHYGLEARADLEAGSAYSDLFLSSDFGNSLDYGFALAPEYAGLVNMVEYLSVPAPVPEPQTWVMLLLGLGLTAGWLHRRGG
jgi:hypothetical protein